jgi:hypothetical protein
MSQTPSKISKSTERKLLGYLDKVAEHINQGDTPSEAIVKVARSQDVELGHVRLLSQAYNNARTNQQRKSSDDLYEKIGSFDLADIKKITEELYPSQIKTAAAVARDESVSDDYKYAPKLKLDINPQFERFTKLAAYEPPPVLPRDETRHVKKAHSLLKELNHNFEEKRRLVHASHDKVAAAYDELTGYFKQAYAGVSQSDARHNSVAFWGRPAQVLMDAVAQDVRSPNRGGDKFAAAMDRSRAPYNLIEKCLDAIKKHAHYKGDFHQFSKQAEVASERLVSPFLPTLPQRVYGSIVKKAAKDDGTGAPSDVITGMQGITGMKDLGVTKAIEKGMGKPEAKLKTEAYMAVTDPQHEAKIRGLKSQAMLSDMMANDPFLSGEQPERVMGLYNQITKLSPRAADQPLLMRALLRRYLAQGQVDPHDIDQLAGIEVKLKQRDEPQREYNLPKLPQDFTQQGSSPVRRED